MHQWTNVSSTSRESKEIIHSLVFSDVRLSNSPSILPNIHLLSLPAYFTAIQRFTDVLLFCVMIYGNETTIK